MPDDNSTLRRLPWTAQHIAEATDLLTHGNPPSSVITYLTDAVPTADPTLAEVVVLHLLTLMWSQARSTAVAEARLAHLPWASIAAASGMTSSIAAQRHFTRSWGSMSGYTPRNTYLPRLRPIEALSEPSADSSGDPADASSADNT